ncbi:hypothetical protein EYW48_21155 [Vibrio sp. 1180_3]|nr:hypothetical protein [Vibrio sp. 1180_3]
MVIYSAISSLPSAFRGLGFNFTAVRFTLLAKVQQLTRRLRRIPNAWHFQFGSALVFTAQWFRLGGGVVHPLTQR